MKLFSSILNRFGTFLSYWIGIVLAILIVLEVSLSSCANIEQQVESPGNTVTTVSANNVESLVEAVSTPTTVQTTVTALEIPRKVNSSSNTSITKKALNSTSFDKLAKHSIKFIKKVSNDLFVKGVTDLIERFTGNKTQITERSHDSTFALIAFVTFSTFVVFTLLPLLTLPRRQRLAKQYARKFGTKPKLIGPKIIPLQNLYNYHQSVGHKHKIPSSSSYAAVAVPIGAPPPKYHPPISQLQDISKYHPQNSQLQDISKYHPPISQLQDISNGNHAYGGGGGGEDDNYNSNGFSYDEENNSLPHIQIPLPHQFHKHYSNYIDEDGRTDGVGGGGNGEAGRGGGGFASNISPEVYTDGDNRNKIAIAPFKPINTNPIIVPNRNSSTDDEYLTKDEIMYLLKTLK